MRSLSVFVSLATVAMTAVACSSSSTSSSTPDAGAGSPDTGPAPTGTTPAGDSGAPPASTTLPAGYTAVPYASDTPTHTFTKSEQVLDSSRDYIAAIETDVGTIVLDLYESDTPITVNSFVFLATHHFYEGILFHRVIDGFMAQTGDPNTLKANKSAWGSGGCGYEFGLEIKPTLRFEGPGVLGMARADSPDSNGSQFFITFATQASLDDQYTVWGKVISGLDVLPKIVRGEPPATPSKIVSVTIGTKAK